MPSLDGQFLAGDGTDTFHLLLFGPFSTSPSLGDTEVGAYLQQLAQQIPHIRYMRALKERNACWAALLLLELPSSSALSICIASYLPLQLIDERSFRGYEAGSA